MIPFNKPFLAGREIEYMRQAIDAGHISGDGSFSRRCHQLLQEMLGVSHVLLTTSCTHALEMAAILLDLREGDEFILPSYTFVSMATAFTMRGARPRFADIRPDTLNIDERGVEELVTPRTKAIVVVHYAGVACEMESINAVAKKHGLRVVEDNAHGLLGRYRDRMLGTLGDLTALSFHETKNFSCGEGGAIVLNDERYFERAEIIREKGTNRARFFRGEVDKYTWVDGGSSYLPSDLLAAHLLAQLEERDGIQSARARIWNRYAKELGAWAAKHGVRLPVVPPQCSQSYHMFYMLTPSLEVRQRMIHDLRARGIYAVFHYQPLHISPMGRRFGGREGECPTAERVADVVIRLPFYTGMTDLEQERVIEGVLGTRF